MARQTDSDCLSPPEDHMGQTMLPSHTLTMRGSHEASLVKFRPMV